MVTKAELPKVRTDEVFKKKVYMACKSNSVTYSQAVRILMQNLIEGKIKIKVDEDYDFEQNAKIALESESTNAAFEKLKKNFDSKRIYLEATKA